MLSLPNFFGLWLSTSLGAVTLLTCLLTAWGLYRAAKKSKQGVFYGLSALTFVAGIVGFFAVQAYRIPWLLLGIILCVLATGMYELWTTSFTPTKAARRIIVIGLTLALTLPLATSAYVFQSANTQTEAVETKITALQNYLDTVRVRLTQTGDKLAINEEIIPLTAGGDYKIAYNILRRELVNNELQMLILTDGSGSVIARGHSASVGGDLIQDSLPWLAPLFTGKAVSGIAYTEDGVPAVVYAVPLTKGSRLLGSVIVGKSFNDKLLATSSDIIGSPLAIAASTGYTQSISASPDEKVRLSSPELTSWAIAEMRKPRPTAPILATVRSPAGTSEVAALILDTLQFDMPITLITTQ